MYDTGLYILIFEFVDSRREDKDLILCKTKLSLRHRDAKGVRRYSSYSFLISAVDEGELSASRAGRGLLSELVWIHRLEEKAFASARDRTPVIQSAVRHYTD
jgi:hypothetical protein